MTSWNPDQYERFKVERRQPFDDLVALIDMRPRMRVVDLGCGTGELTRDLHARLAADETIGIDNSETMLLKSNAFGDEMLRFERGDIEAFVADRPFDLIFSNAALHWVNDHPSLFRRLAGFLSAHGQLAIQMPPTPSERDFYEELLVSMGCVIPAHQSVTTLRQRTRVLQVSSRFACSSSMRFTRSWTEAIANNGLF